MPAKKVKFFITGPGVYATAKGQLCDVIAPYKPRIVPDDEHDDASPARWIGTVVDDDHGELHMILWSSNGSVSSCAHYGLRNYGQLVRRVSSYDTDTEKQAAEDERQRAATIKRMTTEKYLRDSVTWAFREACRTSDHPIRDLDGDVVKGIDPGRTLKEQGFDGVEMLLYSCIRMRYKPLGRALGYVIDFNFRGLNRFKYLEDVVLAVAKQIPRLGKISRQPIPEAKPKKPVQGLQIRIGKKYVTQNGGIYGPMRLQQECDDKYCFFGYRCKPNGQRDKSKIGLYFSKLGEEAERLKALELVSEFVPPAA